jgi:MFS family permease
MFVALMLMTAITELGTEQWIPSILTVTTGAAGILYLCWINGLMAIGRTFAGEVVHRLSPTQMLIASSAFGIVGIFTLSQADNPVVAGIAATIFAVGVCFYWPTMLGVVSERFPKTGALGLAIMGGAGMFASGAIQPIIGKTYDAVNARTAGGQDALAKLQGLALDKVQAVGGRAALEQVVILPCILVVVFIAIYLYDKQHGGYRKVTLEQRQPADEQLDATRVQPSPGN